MLEHFKLNWEFEPQHKINICQLLLVVALSKKRKSYRSWVLRVS